MRLGHSGTTLFRRMLLLITWHNLITAEAEKTHNYMACIKGKFIKKTFKWHYLKNYPLPFSKLMEIFVGQLIHPLAYLGIILCL